MLPGISIHTTPFSALTMLTMEGPPGICISVRMLPPST